MVELGWSEDQFWDSTPALYFACLAQHNKRARREDFRAGIIWAAIKNFMLSPDSEPTQPFDAFPVHQAEKDRMESRRERRQRQIAELNMRKAVAMKAQAEKKAKEKAERDE